MGMLLSSDYMCWVLEVKTSVQSMFGEHNWNSFRMYNSAKFEAQDPIGANDLSTKPNVTLY